MKHLFHSVAITVLALGSLTATSPEAADRALDLASFDQLWETVRDRHYDPNLGGLNWVALRDEFRPKVQAAQNRSEARRWMAALLGRLGQSHFQIIPREFLEAFAGPRRENGFEGETGLDVRVVGEEVVVTQVEGGFSAAEAGVRAGWAILRIDGEDTRSLLKKARADLASHPQRELMLAGAAKDMLAGKPGALREVVFEDGEGREVGLSLTLRERKGERTSIGHIKGVSVRAEARALEGGVGYVAFTNFIHPHYVMTEFNQAMERFDAAAGIIIDLRGNTGGMLDLAMGMSGWFIASKEASLGRMTLRGTVLNIVVRPRQRVYGGRVAILVDALSASCAEAFAAGMQDNGRARVFGQRTAGAVLASAIEKLPNGDALQFVFADYVSSGGRRLEGAGVVPDVEAPWDRAGLLAGRDAALERALEWIREEGVRR